MPTALTRDGFRYFFYSNDHEPVHVHVSKGSGSAKFDITEEVRLVESNGLKVQELSRAQEIAEQEVETLRVKWHEYFG